MTSSNEDVHQHKIEEIVRESDTVFQQIDPNPFSQQAFLKLKDNINQYISQLITESIKISERRKEDTVSSNDVDKASEYLISSNYRAGYRHLGTIGGLLLGTSLSTAASMTLTNEFTIVSILFALVAGITGGFLIALQITRE
ncbi:MAG: hypothetical protein KA094_02315 [Methanoregulaceae archaeon]|jgi:histone H3/H4|nr:hypothetical protein [Methanoregulaceae archaeon]NLH78275.1 hypothetical protein [Acidobacteriota bacterium]